MRLRLKTPIRALNRCSDLMAEFCLPLGVQQNTLGYPIWELPLSSQLLIQEK